MADSPATSDVDRIRGSASLHQINIHPWEQSTETNWGQKLRSIHPLMIPFEWNIRGKNKFHYLKKLFIDNNPVIVVLQEIHLRPEETFQLRGYETHFRHW